MSARLGLALAVCLALALGGAWYAGREAGRADGRATCAQAQTADYRAALEQSAAHLRDVNAASDALFQRWAKRSETDQQTTRELRHALAETASERATCRFPADVMQQLDAARQRANRAATGTTASGPGATLPTPAGAAR